MRPLHNLNWQEKQVIMQDEKELILITGSCGRIGREIVKRLNEKYPIIGFDLLKAYYEDFAAKFVPMDLTSEESVYQAFQYIKNFYKGCKIASFIHLASYYSFDQKESPLYQKITVEGTKRVLKALQDFEVEQFIFSSSMLVHAPCSPEEKINEDWPLEGNWGYPRSKIRTEKLIKEERGKIPAVILRIAGGYNDDCSSIPLSHQIQRIYENKIEAHFYPGKLSHGSSYVHFDDIVDAIEMTIAKRKKLPKEATFLIGEPKTLSYGFLQNEISLLLFNKRIKTYKIPKMLAKIGAYAKTLFSKSKPFIKPWMISICDDNYTLDISRAKKILGWQPNHDLETALPKMIHSLKEDKDKWYKNHNLKKQ
ncbi:MAG: hypothetical protein Tsb0015_10680 [Simkaniaceae bacterium]